VAVPVGNMEFKRKDRSSEDCG